MKMHGKVGKWLCEKMGHKFAPGGWKVMFGYECRLCDRCLKMEKRALTEKRPSYLWLRDYLEGQMSSKPRLLVPMMAAVQALAREGTSEAYLALEAIAYELGWRKS